MNGSVANSTEIAPRSSRVVSKEASIGALLLLAALTVVHAGLYAVISPPFTAPDERAHFQYVANLATGGASGPRGAEEHQPVLYYALMVPAFWLSTGQSLEIQLLAVRLASALFLVGVVFFTWLTARRLYPGKPVISVLAAALVAMLPQAAYIGASANNDNAATFVASVLVYLSVRLLTGAGTWIVATSARMIGIAIMSKGQILPAVALFSAILMGQVSGYALGGGWKRTLSWVAVMIGVVAPALQTPSGLMLAARAQRVLSIPGQWQFIAKASSESSTQPVLYQLMTFAGAFVAETIHPDPMWYIIPAAVLFFGAVGYGYSIVDHFRRNTLWQRRGVFLRVILATMVAAGCIPSLTSHLLGYLDQDSWTLQWLQGRYILVILSPLALLLAEGCASLIGGHRCWVVAFALIIALAAFDVACLTSLVDFYAWSQPT